jgi:L-2-hydroxyglutarate oxidase LhgO
VHFTITAKGEVKIGPTAMPAFWREQYKTTERFNLSEAANIIGWQSKLMASNAFGFRQLAWEEIKKYRQSYLLNQAANLVKNLDLSEANSWQWSKPGIRAQLLNKKTLSLVQDFVVEGDSESTHVLNAVSPAFTCSWPFAEWVVGGLANPNK